MTDPRTAESVWEWLGACKDCGLPHDYREPGPCGCCADCTCPPRRFGTWASVVDGHAYRPRFGNGGGLTGLRALWEKETAP